MNTRFVLVMLCIGLVVSTVGCGIKPPIPVPAAPPCEVLPGQSTALAATGAEGATSLEWFASIGQLTPNKGPAVTYTAPKDYSGTVIITVIAKKGNSQAQGQMTCTVLAPPPSSTPEPTATLPPTPVFTPTAAFTPTPLPTQWACTSYRSERLQDADIPGTVTIDTPPQGTTDLPAKTSIQVAGTYSGIPEGKYLWVFIYSGDAGLHGRYYPQTVDALKNWQPVPITEPEGRWSIDVGFGAPNLCYEVIVLVADAEASKSIADQLKAWADLDNYAGYELNGPETAIPPDAPGFPDGLVEKASIEVKTR